LLSKVYSLKEMAERPSRLMVTAWPEAYERNNKLRRNELKKKKKRKKKRKKKKRKRKWKRKRKRKLERERKWKRKSKIENG